MSMSAMGLIVAALKDSFPCKESGREVKEKPTNKK
jgi:hypothetical protein